jgi:hypothetical protein
MAIYSVFKKALKPLKDEKKKWLRIMWIIFFVGLPINLVMLMYMEVKVFKIYNDSKITGINE